MILLCVDCLYMLKGGAIKLIMQNFSDNSAVTKCIVPNLLTSNKMTFGYDIACPLRVISDVNAGCDSDGIQKTDITWDVAADRSYSYQLTDSSGAAIIGKC